VDNEAFMLTLICIYFGTMLVLYINFCVDGKKWWQHVTGTKQCRDFRWNLLV